MNSCLQYLFARVYELLNRNTFDTYRVSVHNPYTIFVELNTALDKYQKKRIRHFDPTITHIGIEAKTFVAHPLTESVLNFGTFSSKQVEKILDDTCKKKPDGKRNRTLQLLTRNIIISNEKGFKGKLLAQIAKLTSDKATADFQALETIIGWLISQLVYLGYSRTFIKDRFHKCEKSIQNGKEAIICWDRLTEEFSRSAERYDVLFKLKIITKQPFLPASSHINEYPAFPEEYSDSRHINTRFKNKTNNETYYAVSVTSFDFWSALKQAHQLISETIELNILNNSESNIMLEHQALAIHHASRRFRMETLEERLDGFYTYHDGDFKRFIDNYKKLGEGSVAKEKVRSAIRFYKLGNESMEMEHKILNYWIGFEQLFAAVDNEEDSIKRIKSFFISMNGALYLQSRLQYLIRYVEKISGIKITLTDLAGSIEKVNDHVLLSERLKKYQSWFNDPREIKKLLVNHVEKLEQHITRIYRLRNELVHEGRSESVSLFLIAGHLRHYLLFSIEQITNELADNPALDQLDDVFVFYENLLDRIKEASGMEEIIGLKPYKGFME